MGRAPNQTVSWEALGQQTKHCRSVGGGQGSHGPTSRALPLGSRQARASECPQVLSVLSTLVNDILDKLPVALSIRDRGAALLCKVDSLRCEPCKGLAWG